MSTQPAPADSDNPPAARDADGEPGSNAVEHEPDPQAKPLPDGHRKYIPSSPYKGGDS